jgi:uncharacterized protein with GYD domain
MATFIVLCNFEEAGIDHLLDSGSTVESTAERLMEEVGGKLQRLWLTTGDFDLVVVVEADNTGDALAFLVAFSSLGRVRTKTLTAEASVDDVVEKASEAKTKIGEGSQ